MTYTKAVAMRTVKLLLEKGMTQYELCKRTGMNLRTLQRIIHEQTTDIKFSTVDIIANGLGMTFQDFCNDELFGKNLGGNK